MQLNVRKKRMRKEGTAVMGDRNRNKGKRGRKYGSDRERERETDRQRKNTMHELEGHRPGAM
jgi:hypothetical protein